MANFTLDYTGAEVNELLNKIDTAYGEETVMGDTLTWDGNTEGLYNVFEMFYKVSDATPTLADLQSGGTFSIGGMDIPFTGNDVVEAETLGIGNGVILITSKGNPCAGVALEVGATSTMNGVVATFEETGFFLLKQSGIPVERLTVNGYTGFETTEIKPIDSKYIVPVRTYFYYDTANDLYIDEEQTTPATPIDVMNAYNKGQIVIKDVGQEMLPTSIDYRGYPMGVSVWVGSTVYHAGSLD